MAIWAAARSFLELIKFEHTVFALPFAYLGMLLAAEGWPGAWTFAWITVAMAAARTLGMSANRLLDRRFDAANPRTSSRPLVTGAISARTAITGSALSAGILTAAALALGPLPTRLLPGALVVLIGYPLTKRFTELTHFILGAADGLAPLGAWAAVRGTLASADDLPAWILFALVTSWIAGFDMLYACQDVEFDRAHGLRAIPARFGIPAALRLSAVCHAATGLLLVALGLAVPLGWPYWLGAGAGIALLAYEHTLVAPDDLSRIDRAFFQVNSVLSLTLLAATAAALIVR